MPSSNKHIIIENCDKLRIIKFNNLRKKNALNKTAYGEITQALNAAAADESVNVVAVTGVGEFFTSGNDLTSVDSGEDFDSELQKTKMILNLYFKAFIEFPKLLIAVVNGPCIGIGVTSAALCDVVYCTESAYFYTPFTKLGLCPEGCSSYLFPLILGRSKACELLLLNHKMDAQEALKFNFVSSVYKQHELDTKLWPKIQSLGELPKESLQASKRLIQKGISANLEKAMNLEAAELHQRWYSEEFSNAITEFILRKKSKL